MATAKAIFAGGCFWCVESDFDKVPGVLSTTSGYTGGTVAEPDLRAGVGQDAPATPRRCEIVFDPSKVSYAQLRRTLLAHHRPDHQGPPVLRRRLALPHGDLRAGRRAAEDRARQSKAALEKTKPFKEPIVTEVSRAGPFYPAEDYHQDYYKKNPIRYKYYRTSCGRDARLQQLWGAQAVKH